MSYLLGSHKYSNLCCYQVFNRAVISVFQFYLGLALMDAGCAIHHTISCHIYSLYLHIHRRRGSSAPPNPLALYLSAGAVGELTPQATRSENAESSRSNFPWTQSHKFQYGDKVMQKKPVTDPIRGMFHSVCNKSQSNQHHHRLLGPGLGFTSSWATG